MEALSKAEGPMGVDAGSVGAMNDDLGTGASVVLGIRSLPVQFLMRLPSVWPRGSLSDTSVEEIRKNLAAVGKLVVPVVVRCEQQEGGTGPIVELVAGEHRVHAASLEGITELPALVLVGDKATAKLWLLREGAEPGTPRGILEVAWQVQHWITESSFSGTQRELALLLGMTESQVSELRKFARALPEKDVLDRAREKTVSPTEVTTVTRAILRRVTRDGKGEALAAVDRTLDHLKNGKEPHDAWSLGLLNHGSALDTAAVGPLALAAIVREIRKLCALAAMRVISRARELLRQLRHWCVRTDFAGRR